MKTRLIAITSTVNRLIVSTIALFATMQLYAQYQPPIFAVRTNDQLYLRYNRYMNELDSCIFRCMIGEFSVTSASSVKRLSLNFLNSDNVYNGDTNQGVNQNLADLSFTDQFIIPTANITISYFKYMHVVSKPLGTGNFKNAVSSNNSYDEYWNVGTGKNTERVEFVIELIHTRTGNRICVIDSFGVLPNPYSPIILRYGANADQLYTSISVSGLTAGDTANIRIIPKRWGATPFGLGFGQSRLFYNNSASMANVNGKIDWISDQNWDTLLYQNWITIRDNFDSTIAATGKLPKDLVDPPMNYEQQYITRYYDSIGLNNQTIVYKPKYQLLAKLAPEPNTKRSTQPDESITLYVTSLSPMPSSAGVITAIVNNTHDVPVLVQPAIYDASGNKIECNSWYSRTLGKGYNTMSFDVKDVASGFYYLVLHGATNEVYARTRFMIQR